MLDVVMPQLGEAVSEGTITRWLRSPGDSVRAGDPLFEVSTDKVDSEVPAGADGTLAEVLVDEGESAAVGQVLARIDVDANAPPSATAPPAVTAERAAEPIEVGPTHEDENGPVRLLSPRVRQLADAHQLDPSLIPATGGRGRLTVDDVVRLAGDATPEVATSAVGDSTMRHSETSIPFTPIRRRIAAHMAESKATAPHAWISVEVDFSSVERVRLSAKEAFREREGVTLTTLPFVARAVIEGLGKYPMLNATVGADELIVHPAINLGIAVDLDFQGLVVVVSNNAETKRLRTLAREFAMLAADARARRAGLDQLTGSTFTITNVGSHGADTAVPIINQPELAILAIGAVRRRPAVVVTDDGGEALAIRSVGALSLSWDHRGVDGAYAAEFLHTTRQILETRDWRTELR